MGEVDSNIMGLGLIALAVGSSLGLLLASRRPGLRRFSLVFAGMAVVVFGTVLALFAFSILAGWYGGIPD